VRPVRTFALALASIALAACASSATPAASPPAASPSPTPAPTVSATATASPSPSAESAALLLEVTSEGGFINPSANLAALPTVAVFTDGRIFTPGAVDSILPGPLVAPVAVRDVGSAGAAAILAAIKQSGLDKPASGGPGIPGDSGTSVFTTIVDGTTTTTRLAGGGPPGPGKPGAASGDPERTAAFELLNRLVDPAETWGAGSAPESPFTPAGYRIYVAPESPSTDPSTEQPPVAWPLPTGLEAFGAPAQPDRGIAGLRQGMVVGADAAQLAPILKAATAATPFTSGGKSYTLWVRPLLPDETGG